MANRQPLQKLQPCAVNPNWQQSPQLGIQSQPPLAAEQVKKHRDYLKQQQRLRLMASSTHKSKPVSTEMLIEDILGKKDTFQTVDNPMTSLSSTNPDPLKVTKPNLETGHAVEWLLPGSLNFPPLYHQVWNMVGFPDGSVDTAKIYPLLLTSGLHTDVLGYIWGLSNRQIPGKLMEPELYVLLALVALAQRGYSFNSASVLSLVPHPPLPSLTFGETSRSFELETNRNMNSQPQETHQVATQHSHLPLTLQSSIGPNFQELSIADQQFASSAITSEVPSEQNDFDDFTDFQSATISMPNFNTSVSLQNPTNVTANKSSHKHFSEYKDIHSEAVMLPPIGHTHANSSKKASNISRTSLKVPDSKQIQSQKFPSVAVIGGGRSIGSRLANHSLATPKSSKTRHKHHHHHHHRSIPPAPPAASVDEEFSDFQQAFTEDVPTKSLSKPPSAHTYILKESAIRVNEEHFIPKIPEPSSKKVLSANEKREFKAEEKSHVELVDTIDSKNDRVLMNIEEDRYSALRALSTLNDVQSQVEEEYSDFFSSQTPSVDNPKPDIAVLDNLEPVNDPFSWSVEEKLGSENSRFETDEWSSFVSSRDSVGLSSSSKCEENRSSDLHSEIKAPLPNTVEWGSESVMGSLTNQVMDLNLSPLSSIPSLSQEEVIFPLNPDIKISESKNFLTLFDQLGQPGVSLATNINTLSNNKEEDDDFGEFVSPDSWVGKGPVAGNETEGIAFSIEDKKTDDQDPGSKLWLDESKDADSISWSDEVFKYDQVKLSKDGTLDNPLVSSLWLEEGRSNDNQSVRSLELPGLDQAWDSVGEWRRCVQSCVSVLQFAVDTFESILEPTVLKEVLTSSEGLAYLRGLAEVWAVCERLATTYKQSGSDHKLDALLNSAESMWIMLKPHFQQAQLTMESETSVEGGEICGICLVNGAKLDFSGHTYHPSCANLWLNLVDTGLPALHLP